VTTVGLSADGALEGAPGSVYDVKFAQPGSGWYWR